MCVCPRAPPEPQAERRQNARAQEAKKLKLLSEVKQQVASDAAALHKDSALLKWVQHKVHAQAGGAAKNRFRARGHSTRRRLPSSAPRIEDEKMARRHALMHTFPDPLSSVEPSSNYLPFNSEFIDANAAPIDRHGARIATTGPSDTYNYWTGQVVYMYMYIQTYVCMYI